MRKTFTALAVTATLAGGTWAYAEDTQRQAQATDPALRATDARTDNESKPMTDDSATRREANRQQDAGERPQDYKADNSGRNQRDASGSTVTPEDQSNDKADLEITRQVRKAVTSDDAISVNGRNVKIVTAGGVVTLRGPVKDEAEKASIAAKAKAVSGVTRVDNQLEVAAQ